MDIENVKKAFDYFEDENYLETRKIMSAEIKDKVNQYVSNETGVELEHNASEPIQEPEE